MKLDYIIRHLIHLQLINCREELICNIIHPAYCGYIENTIENVEGKFYFRLLRYQHFAGGLPNIAMQ